MFQLGNVDVVYNKSAIAYGGTVTAKAVKVTLTVQQLLVKEQLWKKWTADPRNYTREWLSTHGIKALDVLPPKLKVNVGTLRVVAWITESSESKFQKLCGQEAVVTGKFVQTEDDRSYFSVVPLPGANREEALRRAEFHGDDTWGVVPMRDGTWPSE